MKKILYICPKTQYDWEAFIPRQPSSPSEERDISILLLHQGKHIQDIPSSQIFTLEAEQKTHDLSGPYESLSYQQLLEKIFHVDLPLVI